MSVCRWVVSGACAGFTRNLCSSWQRAVGWGGAESQEPPWHVRAARALAVPDMSTLPPPQHPWTHNVPRHGMAQQALHPWQAEPSPSTAWTSSLALLARAACMAQWEWEETTELCRCWSEGHHPLHKYQDWLPESKGFCILVPSWQQHQGAARSYQPHHLLEVSPQICY